MRRVDDYTLKVMKGDEIWNLKITKQGIITETPTKFHKIKNKNITEYTKKFEDKGYKLKYELTL